MKELFSHSSFLYYQAMKISEIVHYNIIEEKRSEFNLLHEKILNRLSKLEGFISVESSQNNKDITEYIDNISWKTSESAEAAFQLYKSFPEAKSFKSCILNVHFSKHFTKIF